MALSKRLRYEILRRDNFACRYCGAAAPDVKLNVDHVIPQALGGSNAPTNLVTACADCNAGKTSSMPNATPVSEIDQDMLLRALALKQVAALEAQTSSGVDRGAEAAHALITDACTAWASVLTEEPTPSEWREFLLEVRQAMKDGYDRGEILAAAESCGASPHRTFLTCELPLYPGRAVDERDGIRNDEEFEVLADVGPVWLKAMRSGPAPYLVVSRLQASIVLAHREGCAIERIKEAAWMGGLRHDPDISVYLGWLASQDAEAADEAAQSEGRNS